MHLVHEEYSQYGHYTEYNLTMVLSIFNLCSTMELESSVIYYIGPGEGLTENIYLWKDKYH